MRMMICNEKDIVLKNNVLFESCMTKTNKTLIDTVEDLDIIYADA